MVRSIGWMIAVAALGLFSGCASFSAKLTGSPRAGAEQLLLTGTADRAIDTVDFRPLAGARVFFDDSHISGDEAATDIGWVVFALRRAMARQGLLLVDDSKDAQVVVEAALGAYGTDEVGCRLTTPSVSSFGGFMPLPLGGSDAQAFSRKVRQDAVVKLALTGLDAETRRLVWDSGTVLKAQALDRRFIGTNEIRRRTTLPELVPYPRRSQRD